MAEGHQSQEQLELAGLAEAVRVALEEHQEDQLRLVLTVCLAPLLHLAEG